MTKKTYYFGGALILVLILATLYTVTGGFNRGATGDKRIGVGTAGTADSGESSNRRSEREQIGPRDPRLNPLFFEDRYRISVADLEGYLAKNGRSPSSLAASYLLSRDPLLFEELKTKTDSPVAMICAAVHSSDAAERARYAKIYTELRPNDMTGHLLLANELKASGADSSEIKSSIAKAFTSEIFTGGLEDTASSMREALASTGMDGAATEIYLMTNDDTSKEIIGDCKDALQSAYTAEIKGVKDPATKIKSANEYLGMSDLLREISPHMKDAGVTLNNWLSLAVLKDLPDDLEVGDQNQKVGDLRAALKKERLEMVNVRTSAYNALKNSPPEIVDEFLARSSKEGIVSAEGWLLEQAR